MGTRQQQQPVTRLPLQSWLLHVSCSVPPSIFTSTLCTVFTQHTLLPLQERNSHCSAQLSCVKGLHLRPRKLRGCQRSPGPHCCWQQLPSGQQHNHARQLLAQGCGSWRRLRCVVCPACGSCACARSGPAGGEVLMIEHAVQCMPGTQKHHSPNADGSDAGREHSRGRK